MPRTRANAVKIVAAATAILAVLTTAAMAISFLLVSKQTVRFEDLSMLHLRIAQTQSTILQLQFMQPRKKLFTQRRV